MGRETGIRLHDPLDATLHCNKQRRRRGRRQAGDRAAGTQPRHSCRPCEVFKNSSCSGGIAAASRKASISNSSAAIVSIARNAAIMMQTPAACAFAQRCPGGKRSNITSGTAATGGARFSRDGHERRVNKQPRPPDSVLLNCHVTQVGSATLTSKAQALGQAHTLCQGLPPEVRAGGCLDVNL